MDHQDAQNKRDDQRSPAREHTGVDPRAYEDLQGIDGDGLPTGRADPKRIRKADASTKREDDGTFEECDESA
jgi:hypothetical protein